MAGTSARAVAYATDQLGFQLVYDEAVNAEAAATTAQLEARQFNSNKREISERILDRQAELAVEQRGQNAEMSATAFEAHMKIAIRQDRELRELRSSLAHASNMSEQAEHAARDAELTIRIRTARMAELGGYFQYLAATALLQANQTQENSS